MFFENYVACELASYGIPLFYWKGKNDYEFEFVVKNKDGNIVRILLYVDDEDTANVIITAMQEIDKGGNCRIERHKTLCQN